MATVQSSLKLFDAMSRPLQNITQGMNMLISTMHQMQAATDRNVNIDKTLTAAKHKIAAAESDIRNSIEQANAAQQKFNRSVEKGESEVSRMGDTIKGLAVAYLTMEAARRTWDATVGGAMQQQQTIDTFAARAGSEAVGGAIFDTIAKQALALRQNVDQALSGTMSFMSNTMDPQKLAQLNKLSMRLSKLNPAEGLEGAAFSMKELLSGDYTSIVERFNMGRSQIQQSDALKAGKAGDLDGFIKGMDKLLNQQNMSEKAFEKMLDSPAAKWQGILETFKFQLKQTGSDALTAMAPFFDFMLRSFDAGKFDPFFNALNAGLWLVANLLYGASQAAMFFYGIAVEYWPIIAGILGAIAFIYIPTMTAGLWGMIAPLLYQAAIWTYLNWPILLVGATIGLLIYTLLRMGITAEQMVGAVVGYFYMLFAYIHNQIAVLVNVLASFAEFWINVFIDPVYAVKKLFYDLAKTFMGHMYTMLKGAEDFAGNFMKVVLSGINGVIKGLNWMIEAMNQIPGIDIPSAQLFDTDNVHAMSDGIKKMMDNLEAPTTDKKVVHIARMQEMDMKGSFDRGYAAGAGIVDKVSKALDGFNLPGADGKGDIPNIGKVGEIGKINDTVDISSEDLKVMRDLAEMKSIQNFVTLTPTVNVTTGPISKETDVDEVIRRISERMDQEIESTAQGIYDGQ